ncbi:MULTISPECIES: hypothetical protein [Bacillus cereus group]|uniref:hypothetical protein n=1 Tax=Bacillus cereus group TaxID=86661 RepID=UPI00255175AB|nr:hypothetical protein [Bacillus paranthracis]MDK7489686.1 hypothetical protein [Bacillus paranthracis]
MKNERIDILNNLILEIHEYVLEKSNNEKNNMNAKQNLGEVYLALHNLLEVAAFQPHEKVILKRDLNKIFRIVYDESSLFFYSSFYYAYRKVKNGDPEETQLSFQKINLDVMAMLINITSIINTESDLGSSTEDYFFSRMENCIWAFSYVYKNKIEEHYIPSLYCICNMLQTLILYKKITKNKYSVEVDKLILSLHKILNEFMEIQGVKDILNKNKQLSFFIDNQILDIVEIFDYKRLKYTVDMDSIKNQRTLGVLRILSSLYKIDKDNFKEYFEYKIDELIDSIDRMSILEKVLFLKSLTYYYTLDQNYKFTFDEIGLFEELNLENTEDFLNQVFQLNRLNISGVSQEDLEKLLKMKDDELRIKFSKTINGVEERILVRESQKPHGAFEISDMELPISFRGKRYYMCMPFKSGVEIRGNTVPVDISYQIVRPFIEFKNCVVVFVTAKKCSENLMNYIKKLKDSMNWPIEVIEHTTLAALLKNSGEL